MWSYLSRLELKNSLIYYLFLLIFFFFWNFFSLFTIYLYTNFQKIADIYKNRVYLNLIIYSQKSDNTTVTNLVNNLKQLLHVKKVEVFPPEKIFQKIKNSLPSEIFKNYKKNEIINYFPYVVKIYPTSFKSYSLLKNQLQLLKSSNNKIDIYEAKISKMVNFAFVLKPGFFCFFIIWIVFYILFLLFFNYFLNSFLDKQIQIFILLGGSLNNFKIIRLFFISAFSSIAFIISTILFLYIANNLSNIFNITKLTQSSSYFLLSNNLFNILIYYILTILVFPAIIIWFSYKKYED